MVLGKKDKKEDEKIDLGEIDPNIIENGDSEDSPPFAIDDEEEEEDLPFEETDDEETKEASPFETEEDTPPFDEGQEIVPSSPISQEFDEKIASLEEKVNQMDSTLANVRRLHEELEEKINKVEKSLEDMLSVYELVTNEINPFVQKQEEAEPYSIIEQTENIEKIVPKEVEEPSPVVQMEQERDRDRFPATQMETPEQKIEDFQILSQKEDIYLADIKNDPNSIMILLKWIEFMLKKVGFRGMVDLLIYYENIGWISEKVRNKIIKYAREMRINEKPKAKRMGVKEHLISLYFIAKLQGLKVNTKVYSSIAYELERIGILC